MPRPVLKVCGGGGWLRTILVFSLSLDQAVQYAPFTNVGTNLYETFREP